MMLDTIINSKCSVFVFVVDIFQIRGNSCLQFYKYNKEILCFFMRDKFKILDCVCEGLFIIF